MDADGEGVADALADADTEELADCASLDVGTRLVVTAPDELAAAVAAADGETLALPEELDDAEEDDDAGGDID